MGWDFDCIIQEDDLTCIEMPTSALEKTHTIEFKLDNMTTNMTNKVLHDVLVLLGNNGESKLNIFVSVLCVQIT